MDHELLVFLILASFGVSWERNGGMALKLSLLMCSDNLQNRLHFVHSLLILVSNLGIQGFSLERMGEMA